MATKKREYSKKFKDMHHQMVPHEYRRKGKENDDEAKDDYYEDHTEDDEYEKEGHGKDALEGTDFEHEKKAKCYIKQHDEEEGEPGYEDKEWWTNKSPWSRKEDSREDEDDDEGHGKREEAARSSFPESGDAGQRKVKRVSQALEPENVDGDGYPKNRSSKQQRKSMAVLALSKRRQKASKAM